MTRIYTEAEIFEAVCWAIGDDGNTATRTIKVLNSNRKAYGKVENDEYAKCRQDFNISEQGRLVLCCSRNSSECIRLHSLVYIKEKDYE